MTSIADAAKPDLKEILNEADKLEKEENDPRTPFKTFYKAREILVKKRDELLKESDKLKKLGTNCIPIDNAIGVLNYRIGKNFYTTEENHDAQVHLEKAILQLAPEKWNEEDLKLSEDKDDNNKHLNVTEFSAVSCLNNPYLPQLIDAYNQIGALWVSRGDTKKGKLNLSRALKIHETIQKFDDGSSSKEDQEELRTIHIFTLFYLAQVEGQLGNAELSSGHVRKTLILQRENSDYEPVEWAINCAQLHNYYYNQLNLREAENCLLCAQEIANNELPEPKYEKDGKTPVNIDDETLRVRCTIWRMWGTLYSKQLEIARKNLEMKYSQNFNGMIVQDEKIKLIQPPVYDIKKMSTDVIKKRRAPYVQAISNAKIAADVFKLSRLCYEKSLSYFVMDGRVTEHVNIQQEISKLYMHLSGFETEWKRAVGMQTRRVSLLSPLYEQLNKNVFIVLCKELSFECGQALQSVQDVHEMRLNQLEKGSKKFISAMKKADKAGVEAMVHFSRFLTHFLTKEGTDPEFMDKDNLPSYLLCHLNMARICGKMYSYNNNQMKVQWLKKSLKEYQLIVEFGERNIPSALEEQKKEAFLEGQDDSTIRPIFKEEMKHCKQMIQLLPEKINRLHYFNQDISD